MHPDSVAILAKAKGQGHFIFFRHTSRLMSSLRDTFSLSCAFDMIHKDCLALMYIVIGISGLLYFLF